MRLSKPVVISLVAAMSLGAMAATVLAADAIHDRQQAMEAVGDSMKSLAAIARGKAPFDAEVVKTSATTIADNLKKAAELFPEGSEGEKSKAKPEVWSDAAGFEKIMKEAHAAAVALQSVSEEAAFGPALGTLGSNCKSCHDKYRQPEQ
jgi:cytochrome c556